jgi:peptide/nickel transport system substrate-binding protein
VKEVRAPDEQTVEIVLKERDAVFLHKSARPRPVAIVPRSAIDKFGAEFARNPIGSGPFVFQSMSREEIVLTANRDYVDGPPKIDKLVYKVIPDVDTLVLALEKGDVHLGVIVPREKAVMDRLRAAGRTIKFVDRGAWHMMLVNPKVKPLDDVRVRRAIAHAIDRDSIITHVLSGTAQRLDSLVPRGYFGHTEEGLRKYEYDPKKAKQLLTEAGYPDGFDLVFDTFTSPSYLPIATAIQNQLEKVGIRAKLSVADQPTWMKKITGGTAAISLYLPVRTPDADIPLVNFFHSAGVSPGPNLARYDKVDKEITAARAETDPAKRRKMYHEIQKRLMEDLPAIPLFMMAYPTPHVKTLAGIPDRDPVWYFDFSQFYFSDRK